MRKYTLEFGIYGQFTTKLDDLDYSTAVKIAESFIKSVQDKGECLCDMYHMGIVGIVYNTCFAKVNPIEEAVAA